MQFRLPPLFLKGLLTVTLPLIGLTDYGLISATPLEPVACQKVVLEQGIVQLHAEQGRIRSGGQNLWVYSAQQNKETQNLQGVSAEIKNNIENLQGRDSEIRGKFGLPAESSTSGGGETARAETQASETPVGEAKTMESLQPLMLGDAGESDVCDTATGTPTESTLQRESNIQFSVLMGACQRQNTMQLAVKLEQSHAMFFEASDNYDQYEGMIHLQEFQEEQRRERTTQQRQSVRAHALSFLGGCYVWGGEDLYSGVDCSGFTRHILSHVGGVYINRTAMKQTQQGREVPVDEVKLGDLIFCSSGSRVNHVAVYIDNDRVVHASNERSGIMVSHWNYRTPVHIRSMVGK